MCKSSENWLIIVSCDGIGETAILTIDAVAPDLIIEEATYSESQ